MGVAGKAQSSNFFGAEWLGIKRGMSSTTLATNSPDQRARLVLHSVLQILP
jgi:hypothetical protein